MPNRHVAHRDASPQRWIAPTSNLDMSHAVCRLCKYKVKYCSNTTNLHLHIARHHPEQQVLAVGDKEATPGNSVLSQPKMSDTFKSKYPSTSAQAQKITEALLCFICKDLRPYSVVDSCSTSVSLATLFPLVGSSQKQQCRICTKKERKSQKNHLLCRESCHHMWCMVNESNTVICDVYMPPLFSRMGDCLPCCANKSNVCQPHWIKYCRFASVCDGWMGAWW